MPRTMWMLVWLLFAPMMPAQAQVSVAIGLPNVNIGINLPVYPQLVQVPNYPVYYAPRLNTNYFFYDGLYWVYQDDDWYASSWYNGPWGRVARDGVPLFVLRIPVGYYRSPPPYFRGWRADAPPRWGEHWGNDWQQRRAGWDRWDRKLTPRPAPLPVYQRQFSGERYPRVVDRQQALHDSNYRYQPRDSVVQQHQQQQRMQNEQNGIRTSAPGNLPRHPAEPAQGMPRHDPRDDGDKGRGDNRGDKSDDRGRGREK